MSLPSDHWISELIRTIQECRAENDGQRFGQLLYNLIAKPEESQAEFHARLFYIDDYELVQILKEYKDGRLSS